MALTAGNVGPIYRFGVFTTAAWREMTKTNLVLVFKAKMAIAAPKIMKSNVNKPDSRPIRIGFRAGEYSSIPHGAGKYHTALNYTVRSG